MTMFLQLGALPRELDEKVGRCPGGFIDAGVEIFGFASFSC